MALNWWLVASGVLVSGLGVFHSVLGELYIVRRLLRRADLPKLFGDDSFTRLTIRYAWHLLTIFCLAASAVLFLAATDGGLEPAVWILVGMLTLSGMWGLVSTRGRHLSWIVLLAAAVMAAVGTA